MELVYLVLLIFKEPEQMLSRTPSPAVVSLFLLLHFCETLLWFHFCCWCFVGFISLGIFFCFVLLCLVVGFFGGYLFVQFLVSCFVLEVQGGC